MIIMLMEAVLFPGVIVTVGVTIGKNSIISVGSVVTQDIPDYCIVVGNTGRVIKKLIIKIMRV